MKAFVIDKYGEAGQIKKVTMRPVGPEDVLVKISAASINPLDLKIRDGKLKPILPYMLPLILGNDMAGVVVKVGPKVSKFTVGDEVYARPNQGRIGTFAEYISVAEQDVARKPKTLSMNEAAAVPLVGLTAWQILVERANIQKGDKVLIHAGSGGVGTFAIQLAKHLGATVATTVSKDNFKLVKDLGADVIIDYKTQQFEDILEGYDLVLDTQGGTTLEKSVQVLKPGGKVISISGPPDYAFAKSAGLNIVLRFAMSVLGRKMNKLAKRHGVSYSFLFMASSGEQLKKLAEIIDQGLIRIVIDRIFPFDSTKAALAYVEGGRAKGKVVVSIE